jgi:hypothetical protein
MTELDGMPTEDTHRRIDEKGRNGRRGVHGGAVAPTSCGQASTCRGPPEARGRDDLEMAAVVSLSKTDRGKESLSSDGWVVLR